MYRSTEDCSTVLYWRISLGGIEVQKDDDGWENHELPKLTAPHPPSYCSTTRSMADKTDITPEQQVELQGDLLSDGSLSSTGSSQPTKVAALPDNVPGPQAEVMGGHSEDTESQRSSPVDPILELLEFSEDIMCPDVSNILIGQLEGNHNPTPVLLELARFFRAQACLLREQAKILDELAISDTIEGPDTDIDEGLYRNRVAHFVKLSCGAMVAAHDHIDALEDSVYPWNET